MPRFKQELRNMVRRSAGQSFWRKITVTSSSILTTATNISAAATGDLAITQVVVKTDSTGLAGGTNFVLASTNAKGVANILVETVANLGANTQKVLAPGTADTDTTTSDATPSVTSLIGILSAGKKLTVTSTSAVCTGVGTIDIYIRFERVDENADINMVGNTI